MLPMVGLAGPRLGAGDALLRVPILKLRSHISAACRICLDDYVVCGPILRTVP